MSTSDTEVIQRTVFGCYVYVETRAGVFFLNVFFLIANLCWRNRDDDGADIVDVVFVGGGGVKVMMSGGVNTQVNVTLAK